MSQEERGHDGLTSKERIAQMTQPITEDWYSHQIAIVNKRNAKLEADNKALLDALKTCRSFLATHPEYQGGWMDAESAMDKVDAAISQVERP